MGEKTAKNLRFRKFIKQMRTEKIPYAVIIWNFDPGRRGGGRRIHPYGGELRIGGPTKEKYRLP